MNPQNEHTAPVRQALRSGLLLSSLASGDEAGERPSARQLLTAKYTTAEIERGVYVGSELCLVCHKEYRTWKNTKHALSIRKPMERYSLVPGKGVVADHDRLKMSYRDLFFMTNGKVPGFGLNIAQFAAEKMF